MADYNARNIPALKKAVTGVVRSFGTEVTAHAILKRLKTQEYVNPGYRIGRLRVILEDLVMEGNIKRGDTDMETGENTYYADPIDQFYRGVHLDFCFSR